MKTISIIIPVYNSDEYLEQCLTSVINQTHKNIEIIVVNDGSTDNSFNIIEKFADIDQRIKLLHQKNKGVSAARNAGLEIATGDYIGFVDSDDYIEETMYEELINEAIDKNASIVECGYNIVYSDGKIFNYRLKYQLIEGLYNCIKNYLRQNNSTNYNVNKIYRKDVIENLRYPNFKYSEDFYFNCLAFMNSDTKVTIGTPLYNYYKNPNSATETSFNISKFDSLKSGEGIYKIVENKFPDLLKYVVIYILSKIINIYEDIYETKYHSTYEKHLVQMYRNYYQKYCMKIIGSDSTKKLKILFLLFYLWPKHTVLLKNRKR